MDAWKRNEPPGSAEALFDQLFRSHYDGLRAYALSYVEWPPAAEELVQDVFLEVWERRHAHPLSTVDAQRRVAWANDRLLFDDETLGSVAQTAAKPEAAQSRGAASRRPITSTLDDVPLSDALDSLARLGDVRFTFSTSRIPQTKRVSIHADGVPFDDLVRSVLEHRPVTAHACRTPPNPSMAA